MSTGMIVLLCVIATGWIVNALIGKFVKAKVMQPNASGEALVRIVFLFMQAWVLCEFGSYALVPFHIEIGYWQAFFGIAAIRTLAAPKIPGWTDFAAYRQMKPVLEAEEALKRIADLKAAAIKAATEADAVKNKAKADAELAIAIGKAASERN